MTGFLTAAEIADMTGVINTQTNARLIKLESPGAISDSGDPGDYEPAWQAATPEQGAPALLDTSTSTAELRTEGGRVELSDPTPKTTLTVLDGVAPVIASAGPSWEGWQVTLQDLRVDPPAQRSFRVAAMVRDAPGLLDSVTLTLET